jgi:acyl-CoA hydrolase
VGFYFLKDMHRQKVDPRGCFVFHKLGEQPAFDWIPTLSEIEFTTRKWVRPEDLNANGTLFGGSLLRWIDEEATIHAILQLGNRRVVTKFMSEINFIASAIEGDLIEMGLVPTKFGTTSITMRAEVRNMVTKKNILTVERIVFVGLDSAGVPLPHGYESVSTDRDRFPVEHE